MKNLNAVLKLKKVLIVFLVTMMCMSIFVYADELPESPTATPGSGGQENEEKDPKQPYMEMYVKQKKLEDGTKQILVDWLAYNVINMQAFDINFTYNSKYLQPSYITGEKQNAVLDNIENIKYDQKDLYDSEAEYNDAAKNKLMNAFSFVNNYENELTIQALRYLPSQIQIINEDQENEEEIEFEKLQFAVSKKTENGEITVTDPTHPLHIGTFSFCINKSLDPTPIIEEGSFYTASVIVVCDDRDDKEEIPEEEKPKYNSYLESDIVNFVYQKFGSISGEIVTGYYDLEENEEGIEEVKYIVNDDEYAKKTATIYLFKASDVADIEWDSDDFIDERERLIPFIKDEKYEECYIPDENAEAEIPWAYKYKVKEGDNGIFNIGDIEFDDYIMLIDKFNFADYIVENITIDFNTQYIDLGKIKLIAGDLDKDGFFNVRADRNAFFCLMDLQKDANQNDNLLNSLNLTFAYDFDDDGECRLRGDRSVFFAAVNTINKENIKTVRNFTKENSEKEETK